MKTLYYYLLIINSIFIYSCANDNSTRELKLFPVQQGNEFQYIDRDGKIVINPQFSEASIFHDGLALIRTSGNDAKWGYISEDGKYAISPNYKYATIFSEDLAWVVSENTAPSAINNKGETKITLQDAESVKIFKEGLSAFSIIDSAGLKWGFIDKSGQVKINPQFMNTGNFSNGRCAVQNTEGKWGYIDNEGKLLINYQFDLAKEFVNDKAIVKSIDKTGVIDESGKYLINPQFINMEADGENYLIVQNEKIGWCDQDGKIIINPQFGNAYPFYGNKLAAVMSGGNWGYIDIDGKFAINPQFDVALPFNGNIALVRSSNKYGFIDSEGKYTINPQFDDVAEDLKFFLINRCSHYEIVTTEYFNIDQITSRISINKPEGLSLNSELSDIISFIDNYKKQSKSKNTGNYSEADRVADSIAKVNAAANYYADNNSENDYDMLFNRYTMQHNLFKDQIISNDASIDFYVYVNAYKTIPDGWYTRQVLNTDAEVLGFAYILKLKNKAYGKEKIVIDALEKSFLGYNKVDTKSTKNYGYYTNGDKVIVLTYEDRSGSRESYIGISINNNQENDSYEGD
jgi:hypothetical protein